MGNLAAKLTVLALGVVYAVLHVRVVQARGQAEPRVQAVAGGMLGPALLMTLALAVNAMPVMGSLYVEHSMADHGGPPSGFGLWLDQLGVLLGTAGLMEVVRRALQRPIEPNDTPLQAGLRVQVTMYRELFTRHVLALVGAAAVFGVFIDGAVALLLSIELGLMWAGAAWFLRVQDQKTR